jgi:hypothetical protein
MGLVGLIQSTPTTCSIQVVRRMAMPVSRAQLSRTSETEVAPLGPG